MRSHLLHPVGLDRPGKMFHAATLTFKKGGDRWSKIKNQVTKRFGRGSFTETQLSNRRFFNET
jgi:hypothetical protein